LLMPADHVIRNTVLADALEAGASVARRGHIVLFGVEPRSAATGYGYIRKGAPIDNTMWTVAEFVEKPDAARAESYVASGHYVWNSGIFLAGACQLLEELDRHQPKIVEAARA